MNKIRIHTIKTENDTYQIIRSLKENRKKRSRHKEIFIEGIESIKQAVSACARVKKIIFADYHTLSDWAKGLIDTVSCETVIQMNKKLYNELSDKSDPSELLITIEYVKNSLGDVVLQTTSGKTTIGPQLLLRTDPFILILDRPGNCGNLGSIIRSANSFGVDLVITTGHGVDIYDPKVIRSSLGALFHTDIIHVESFDILENWLTDIKIKTNMQIIGTDSTGNTSIDNYQLKRPIALILGNEAKGMSVRFKELADKIVRITLKGAVNSLNVACAGSILLWQVFKNSRN